MKRRFELPLGLLLAAALSAVLIMAQHPNEAQHGQSSHPAEGRPPNPPRANQGRIPPQPPKRDTRGSMEEEKHENGKVSNFQHVNNDHWYGHDAADDKRYHMDHPYPHGHFEHFGPRYRYNIVRIDRDLHRFWLPGGLYFEVAPWDWFICADWCWDCGDDFVVYDDADHPGWYLLYNVHTGVYVHVNYLGT